MGSIPTPPEMITPEEMAKRCGSSAESIRLALRHSKSPVGYALQMESGGWRYYIPRAEFENWLAGEIPSSHNHIVKSLIDNVTKELIAQMPQIIIDTKLLKEKTT